MTSQGSGCFKTFTSKQLNVLAITKKYSEYYIFGQKNAISKIYQLIPLGTKKIYISIFYMY